MGKGNQGPLGSLGSPSRIPVRVYFSPSELERRQSDPYPPGSGQEGRPPEGVERALAQECGGQGPIGPDQAGGVLLHFFPDPKEVRGVETHFEPKTPEQVHAPAPFQDGDVSSHLTGAAVEILGGVSGPQGRISACANAQFSQALAPVLHERSSVRVQSPPIWSLSGTKNFHTSCEGGGRVPEMPGSQDFCLLGRLANCGSLTSTPPEGYPHSVRSGVTIGFHREPREVQFEAHTAYNLSGGRSRLRTGTSFPLNGQSNVLSQMCEVAPQTDNCRSEAGSPNAGTYVQHDRCSPLLQIEDETVTTAPPAEVQSVDRSTPHEDIDTNLTPQVIDVVVQPEKFTAGNSIPADTANPYPDDGCVQTGMGGSPPTPPPVRFMVARPSSVSQQCPRALGSPPRPPTTKTVGQREEGGSAIRQHDSGVLHKQARGHQECPPMQGGYETSQVVQEMGYLHSRLPRSRDGQYLGRRALTSSTSPTVGSPSQGIVGGVETRPRGMRTNICPARPAAYRPIRCPEQPSVTVVLRKGDGRKVGGRRRPVARLAGNNRVCLPANRHNPKGAGQSGSDRQLSDSVDSALVAPPTLVRPPSGSTGLRASSATSTIRSPDSPASPLRSPSPNSRSPRLDCLDAFKQSFQAAGLSEEAASIAGKARRPSTRLSYNSRLSRFSRWCGHKQVDPFSTSVGDIADFLLHVYKTGAQARTVQGYRSAISAVHHGLPDGTSVSHNSCLSSLIKGMFNERPPIRKFLPEWDLPMVLRSIAADSSPLGSLSMLDLSKRTAFLVAVASGRRCSEIHALSTNAEHMRFSRSGVSMLPRAGFLAKNQTSEFTPTPIVLQDLRRATGCPDDAPWCPVRTLKFYLSRTKALRKGRDQLFLSSRPPYNPASRATIANWVKSVVKSAYSNNGKATPVFRAHSTRAISCSWALYGGATLADIVGSAGWQGSTTFQRVYMRDVLASNGGHVDTGTVALTEAGRR